MKNIVLPLIVIVVCLVNDTATRTISAATSFPLAAVLAGNISGRSSAQPGDTMMRRPDQATTLTFEERVTYQRAIEQVYWRHRIWPKERPDAKPALDAVMTQAQLERKVTAYERDSQALEHWHQPITAEQLQAEMDRMAQHTKQPEVLQELFDALGDDPFVIAECLARPLLAERSLTKSNPHDQKFAVNLERRAGADRLIPNLFVASTKNYTLPGILDSAAVNGCTDDTWTATNHPPVPTAYDTAVWTGNEMIVWGGTTDPNITDAVNTGGRYNPATDKLDKDQHKRRALREKRAHGGLDRE